MIPVGAIILGFITLMGVFTFGSGEVVEYELQIVRVEQEALAEPQSMTDK